MNNNPYFPYNIFPKWITNYATIAYLIALVTVTILYINNSMQWTYLLTGIISVLVFFNVGNSIYGKWSAIKVPKESTFEQKLFFFSVILRLISMFIIYSVFMKYWGDAFGFEDADPTFYHDMGVDFANGIRSGSFSSVWNNIRRDVDFSDLGYAVFLGLIYTITNDSIIVARIIKCLLSAYTVVLMYRISKRNYGEDVGRLTAVFCMLWPNFWYYCGTHLKETEMVFMGVLFVDQADQMLRTRNFSAWKVIPLLLISAALFTFRVPLALVTVLCLLFSLVMSSNRIIGWGKRIVIGLLALGLIALTMGNTIKEQASDLFEQVQSDQQKDNMAWRATRENGNQFAKYASKSVFAPLIFTIPFSTMVKPYEGQEVQQLLNGGNFTKNILSFFTILVLIRLLITGTWRTHLVPLSYLLGYLVVLAMSTFAQSERFHQPAMPMELMFAAYGISCVVQGIPITKGLGSKSIYKRWYNIWVIIMVAATIFWNWFKLAGRGLA